MINAVIEYKDTSVNIHSSEAEYVGTTFKEGFYSCYTDSYGKLFINRTKLDEVHVPFKSPENDLVLKTAEAFFQPEVRAKVNSLGFIHKLGILLHGKQGCGKTSILHHIASTFITHKKAIVFFCDSGNKLTSAIGLAAKIRSVQQNPIIFIADEFERYAENNESSMKNILDGKDSIDNSLFLAATNYINKVPKTLSERPSRFKLVLEFYGIKDKMIMNDILYNMSNKIKPNLFTTSEIIDITRKLDDPTIDELKHICLDKLMDHYLPEVEGRKIGFDVPAKKESESEDDQLSKKPSPTPTTFYIGLKSESYISEEPSSDIFESNV